MKKILEKYKKYSGVLLIILFIIVICLVASLSAKRDYSTVCKLVTADPAGDYNMKATYTIIHDKKGNILKVKEKEEYAELHDGILEELDITTKLLNSTLNNTYGGYTFENKINDNLLTVTTNINFEKIDLEKYSNDMRFTDHVEENKLNKEALINRYEFNGATCEDKQ